MSDDEVRAKCVEAIEYALSESMFQTSAASRRAFAAAAFDALGVKYQGFGDLFRLGVLGD